MGDPELRTKDRASIYILHVTVDVVILQRAFT